MLSSVAAPRPRRTCIGCGSEFTVPRQNPNCVYCSRACYDACHAVWSLDDLYSRTTLTPTGCREWNGGSVARGYCQVMVDGVRWSVHRLAWVLAGGDLPPDKLICHQCDNPPCCEVTHLFLGTYLDNSVDMYRKGRGPTGDRHGWRTHPERHARGERTGAYTHPERIPRGDRHGSRTHPERVPRGERSGSAKLTESQVREILRRPTRGETCVALGRAYCVSAGLISHIQTGRNWRHVRIEQV